MTSISSIIPYLIFGLVIAAFWVYLYRFMLQQNARTQAVRTLAKELGLVFDDESKGPTTLQGTFQGVDLNIYEEVRSSGSGNTRHSQVFTLYNVSLEHIDLPEGLLLYSEGIKAKLGKLFGGQDIQLNDPQFDRTFIIRGESEEHVRAFLNRPNVKQYLLELHDLKAVFRLENNVLTLEFRTGLVDHHQTIHPLLQRMARCVNAMGPPAAPKLQTAPRPAFQPTLLPEKTPPHGAPLENTDTSW